MRKYSYDANEMLCTVNENSIKQNVEEKLNV